MEKNAIWVLILLSNKSQTILRIFPNKLFLLYARNKNSKEAYQMEYNRIKEEGTQA